MARPRRLQVRDLLRREIARRGISQTQAAKEIGVSQPMLSRWLADADQAPSAENCELVAAFVNRPVLEILQLAGRVSRSGDRDTIETDLEWDMVQRELREVFGADRGRWGGLLTMVRGAARLVDSQAGASYGVNGAEPAVDGNGECELYLPLGSGTVPYPGVLQFA